MHVKMKMRSGQPLAQPLRSRSTSEIKLRVTGDPNRKAIQGLSWVGLWVGNLPSNTCGTTTIGFEEFALN
jgi:hypothetical protein